MTILQIPRSPPKDLSAYRGYLAGFVYIRFCSIHYPYYNQSEVFPCCEHGNNNIYIYVYIYIYVLVFEAKCMSLRHRH